MHPHYWQPMGYCRGPRRLLWFIIGAGTATWWLKHREMHNNGWTWGHCRRASIQNVPPNSSPDGSFVTPNQNMNAPASEPPFSFKDIPRTINNIPATNSGWSDGKESGRYQEEQDRLADLRRQATDAMSDMTEATLESILSTAETLKAKLLESREQRRKQQEQLERQIEEQSKNPPRLV